jgi:hypothetical protein
MSLLRNGKTVVIGNFDSIEEKLEPNVYILKHNPMANQYYLEINNDFILPEKLYGDPTISERFIKRFNNTSENLGILLTGLKGTGKTLLAQKVCIDSGLPVIRIINKFEGNEFLDFMSSPELKNSIVYIDEFEKIYKGNEGWDELEDKPFNDNGAGLLSLFDGSFNTKFMFLLTVNDINKLSDFLINRLGRIRYKVTFNELSNEIINNVIDDLLEDKSFKEDLLDSLIYLDFISYDILVNIIYEINMFKEPASKFMNILNLQNEKLELVFIVTVGGITLSFSNSDNNLKIGNLVKNDVKFKIYINEYESTKLNNLDSSSSLYQTDFIKKVTKLAGSNIMGSTWIDANTYELKTVKRNSKNLILEGYLLNENIKVKVYKIKTTAPSNLLF